MPTRAESLRITEAYRAEMLRLRRLAQGEATKIWARVDNANLDATYDLSRLVNTVTSIQGELTQLSAGYVSAFIRSETGEAPLIANIDQSQVGKARSGNSLYRSLRSPVIAMKQAIAEGETPARARTAARKQLVRIVGVATDEAARESLRATMDASPEIEGWQRAVKGTCPACIGAADGSTKPAGESLDIHPSCQCVSEPHVKPEARAQALNKQALVEAPPDLVEKNIYQWTKADQLRMYGMDFTDFGDAVPGGYNYKMMARNEAGEVLGRLEVNTSGRDGVIGIIEVEPNARRQGVATKLLDYFRRYEPDMTLEWGYTTEDGAALKASLPKAWQ